MRLIVLVLVLGLGLAHAEPVMPRAQTPRGGGEAVVRPPSAPPLSALEVKGLSDLLEIAGRQNRSLAQRRAQVARAKGLARQARAPGRLRINGEASGRYDYTRIEVGETRLMSIETSLPLQFEADLSGRVSSDVKAADADVRAAAEMARAAEIDVQAGVVSAWLQLSELKLRGVLLHSQIAEVDGALAVIQDRVSAGLAPRTDLFQQGQQRARLVGLRARLGAEERLLRATLEVLIAAPLELPDPMPDLPELMALEGGRGRYDLDGRPDVRAARAAMRAAQARVDAATAAQLPQLTFAVTPAIGVRRSEQPFLPAFSSEFYSIGVGATVRLPLLDGGTLEGGIAVSHADLKVAHARLEETLQRASREVETAQADEDLAAVDIQSLTAELKIAEQAVQSSWVNYQAGLTDLLAVSTARQSRHLAQRALLAARLRQVLSRVRLHQALGSLSPHTDGGEQDDA